MVLSRPRGNATEPQAPGLHVGISSFIDLKRYFFCGNRLILEDFESDSYAKGPETQYLHTTLYIIQSQNELFLCQISPNVSLSTS